jgi:hypothetical protein
MCKAVDRGMVIAQIQLEEKTGGRRGTYRRSDSSPAADLTRPPQTGAGREPAHS